MWAFVAVGVCWVEEVMKAARTLRKLTKSRIDFGAGKLWSRLVFGRSSDSRNKVLPTIFRGAFAWVCVDAISCYDVVPESEIHKYIEEFPAWSGDGNDKSNDYSASDTGLLISGTLEGQ